MISSRLIIGDDDNGMVRAVAMMSTARRSRLSESLVGETGSSSS